MNQNSYEGGIGNRNLGNVEKRRGPVGVNSMDVNSTFAMNGSSYAASQPALQYDADQAFLQARSRVRLHRVYARLNSLEKAIVQFLQLFGLWPALLQPPSTDALLRHMESADQPLPPSGSSSLADGSTGEAAVQTNGLQWNASLLKEANAASYMFPNAWHPLSFRKTVILEPSLEPQPSQASTRTQERLMWIILLTIIVLNTWWLK